MTIDPHIIEWLNLLTRWIHMIVGVAWIGASFYFNWLEGHLERSGEKPPGVAGDIWSVHGGGFYHAQKYEVAPAKMPETLHWFKWEAYTTWISGMVLLFIVYYLNAGVYMVDPNVADISPMTAIAIGLITLVLGWVVYDRLCKSPLADNPRMLGLVGYLLIVLVAFGLFQVLGGRAAYIPIGAMLGTIMVANVAMVIMPGQRRLVAALIAGETPNKEDGRQALIRSRQNNYITLPVLFLMISNHYPSTFGHQYGWLIIAALIPIGVGVRHYYNLKHKGNHASWMLVAAAIAFAVVAWFAAPAPIETPEGGASASQAMTVVQTHCTSCHSAAPTDKIFSAAPNGVVFDSMEDVQRHALSIKARAVDTNSMPLGNTTGMTDDERAILGAWITEGAKK